MQSNGSVLPSLDMTFTSLTSATTNIKHAGSRDDCGTQMPSHADLFLGLFRDREENICVARMAGLGSLRGKDGFTLMQLL